MNFPPAPPFDDRDEIIRHLKAEITVLREREDKQFQSESSNVCDNSSLSMTNSLIDAALQPLYATFSISKTVQSLLDPNRK